MRFPFSLRQTALAIFAASVATIAGAFVFEYGFGLTPCKLCLIQRDPYYVAMPLALATALAPPRLAKIGLGLLGVVFLVGAVLGIHHAGVEWGFWAGPTDCGGAIGPSAGNVGDFLNQLQTTRVVNCAEAAWRFLGLSLAGWNVVISLALAAFAFLPLAAATRFYGSSSLSQYR
jgi:disulfide bond formation protein DsbB